MNKKVLIIIVLVIALITAVVVFFASRSEAPDTADSTNNAITTFTLEEVAVHNKMADCWTIINGGVYNITNYVPMHPGGDEILLTCGTDGTSLFTDRKTDSGEVIGSGTPHSNTAETQLASYKIGELSR